MIHTECIHTYIHTESLTRRSNSLLIRLQYIVSVVLGMSVSKKTNNSIWKTPSTKYFVFVQKFVEQIFDVSKKITTFFQQIIFVQHLSKNYLIVILLSKEKEKKLKQKKCFRVVGDVSFGLKWRVQYIFEKQTILNVIIILVLMYLHGFCVLFFAGNIWWKIQYYWISEIQTPQRYVFE